MILTHRVAHAVAAGEVGVAYRRWTTPRVEAGSEFRTVAGIVRVESIDEVSPDELDALDDAAARAAGHDTVRDLRATFCGGAETPVWQIGLRWVAPDPRDALVEDDELAPPEIAEVDALLDRLDARTPWARATLRRIADEPGITAGRLAESVPMTEESLKRRIRSLKEYGLTRSLPAGYELSARGRAYLEAGDRGAES